MEEYLNMVSYQSEIVVEADVAKKLKLLLVALAGIVRVNFSKKLVEIEYNPYEISEETIKENLSEQGFSFSHQKKGIFSGWINRLAKSNKANLGNKRLDCCDMNH